MWDAVEDASVLVKVVHLARLLEKQWKSRNVECKNTFCVNRPLICQYNYTRYNVQSNTWYKLVEYLAFVACHFCLLEHKYKAEAKWKFCFYLSSHRFKSVWLTFFSGTPKKQFWFVFTSNESQWGPMLCWPQYFPSSAPQKKESHKLTWNFDRIYIFSWTIPLKHIHVEQCQSTITLRFHKNWYDFLWLKCL